MSGVRTVRQRWGVFVRHWPFVVEGDPLQPDIPTMCLHCRHVGTMGDSWVMVPGIDAPGGYWVECGETDCDASLLDMAHGAEAVRELQQY